MRGGRVRFMRRLVVSKLRDHMSTERNQYQYNMRQTSNKLSIQKIEKGQ